MARIDATLARLESAMAIETNVLLRETLARDLRYWVSRKASAVIATPPGDGRVAFGARVTIRRNNRTQSFRIVGVDEADAAQNLISVHAPLAAALIGASTGDIIEAAPPLGDIEILDVA
jgi:transcription elongation GreA/GreB family factor